MKIGILLQVIAVLCQYKAVNAIYGFGVIKKPSVYLPPQPYFTKHLPIGLYEKPTFTLEDLRIKPEPSPDLNYFGGYLGGHVPLAYGHSQSDAASLLQSQINQQSPVAYGKLLRPILLLPNGWIQGVNMQEAQNIHHNVKPVTEERPDDFKFDFRTQTHSL